MNGACPIPWRETLFDENLNPKLVESLASDYPASTHVRRIGLRRADDQQLWDYARAQAFVLVSKDTDFRERSFVEGFPPKIIWLDVGNTGTSAIEELLGRERARVKSFVEEEESPLLIPSIQSERLHDLA